METVKLYYQDAYLKETKTKAAEVKKENNHLLVSLEQTIFYPGGGGQAADKGSINDIDVERITPADDQILHHLPAGAKIEKGMSVELKIDWPYRFYNMQQHSGQHLISYVLYSYGLQTVSVHLGDEYTLIEVEGEPGGDELLEKVEKECNNLINRALAVKTHWVGKNDLDRFPLRRPARNWEKLRIVEIDKIDYAACGGTHVKNTAEIGLIKIIGREKIRGHLRIKALIGVKAYNYFSKIHGITETLKSELPADLDAVVSRTRQLKDELKEQKKDKKFYQTLYIENICGSLSSNENEVTVYQMPEKAADDLQLLAGCIKKRNNLDAFIVSGNRFCFVTIDEHKEITAKFLSAYKDTFSIKGGGPPGFVQGSIGKFDKTKLSGVLKLLKSEFKN